MIVSDWVTRATSLDPPLKVSTARQKTITPATAPEVHFVIQL